jgi:hypothetical protein
MNSLLRRIVFLAVPVASIGFILCTSNPTRDELSDTNPNGSQSANVYFDYLAAKGFDRNNMREADGNLIIVDDCIAFNKADIPVGNGGLGKTTQRRSWDLISNENAGNIRLMIHSSMSDWTSAIQSAVNAWNTITNSRIHIDIVTTNPELTIWSDADPACPAGFKNLGSTTCGLGNFPANGNVGANISIKKGTVYIGSMEAQKIFLITHEIGHTLGLAHTDENDMHIITTPISSTSDPLSVMTSHTCGGASSLTIFDKIALVSLYPTNAAKRVGVLVRGHFLVKEGDLNASWVDLYSNVTQGVISGTRIGILTGGRFLVKEGGLNAPWVDQGPNWTQITLSDNRIGGIITSGSFLVKEGAINKIGWTNIWSGAIQGVLSGKRIGVLTNQKQFLVKDGALDAGWLSMGTNVVQGALSSDRVGVLLSNGHFMVKEGILNYYPMVDEYSGVVQGVLSGTRIGVLLTNGHFLVKEGSLNAGWVDEYSNVSNGCLWNNRIGVQTTDGYFLVKEGDLSAGWVNVYGGSASGVLPIF